MQPGAALLGVNDPDDGDAHGQVVIYSILHFGEAVVGAQDFDDKKRWGSDDLFARCASCEKTKIPGSETVWVDLYTLFDNADDSKLSLSDTEVV